MIDTKIFNEVMSNEMFDTCGNYEENAVFTNSEYGITFYVEDADTITYDVERGYVNVDMFLFIVEAYKIFSEAFGKSRMYYFI